MRRNSHVNKCIMILLCMYLMLLGGCASNGAYITEQSKVIDNVSQEDASMDFGIMKDDVDEKHSNTDALIENTRKEQLSDTQEVDDNFVTFVEVSTDEQLKFISDNQHIWRDDDTRDSNTSVYYAITDLNLNGRLEVIRSEYCYLPVGCDNSFYEISSDYKALVEMDYDANTMLSSSQGKGLMHDLVTVTQPINCFWNNMYGITEPNSSGMSYYYIIPTREISDDHESLLKMVLCVDNSNKVLTDFVGYADRNPETGEFAYTDYNGFAYTADEFSKAEFDSYSADTGWQCDKVYWRFVTLDAQDNVLEKIKESFDCYTRETIMRLY